MNHQQLTNKELIRHLGSHDDELIRDLVERLDDADNSECEQCAVYVDQLSDVDMDIPDMQKRIEGLEEALEQVAKALKEISPEDEALSNPLVREVL